MATARDFIGLLLLLAIGYSILVNQVIIWQVASDTRLALTLSDQFSMSVDYILPMFVQFALLALFVAISQLALGILLGSAEIARGVITNPSMILPGHQQVARNARHFFLNEHAIAVANSAKNYEVVKQKNFRMAWSRYRQSWIIAAIGLLCAIFFVQDLIYRLSFSSVQTTWWSPAVVAVRVLLSSSFVFVGIYFFFSFSRRRLVLAINGEEVDPDALESRFGRSAAEEIEKEAEEFWLRRQRHVLSAFFVLAALIVVPTVAFAHGYAAANATYFRLITADNPTSTSQSEQFPTLNSPSGLTVHQTALLRVIEQGVLYFDAKREHVVFVNDEGSIRALFPMELQGYDAIGKRRSCVLGVIPKFAQEFFLNIYVFSDLPGIIRSWKLRGCPTLSEAKDILEKAKKASNHQQTSTPK